MAHQGCLLTASFLQVCIIGISILCELTCQGNEEACHSRQHAAMRFQMWPVDYTTAHHACLGDLCTAVQAHASGSIILLSWVSFGSVSCLCVHVSSKASVHGVTYTLKMRLLMPFNKGQTACAGVAGIFTKQQLALMHHCIPGGIVSQEPDRKVGPALMPKVEYTKCITAKWHWHSPSS